MPYKDQAKQLAYQNAWMKRQRLEWLQDKVCAVCGGKAEEVDHIDPSTKVSHRIWSWAKARRETELKKCQPLCSACHKRKSSAASRAKVKHGSYTMHQHYGCRCWRCRKFIREGRAELRARNGK